jgi:beta-1,4-mannosyl-glycoprotein beta-1,4-N-acetylglucosaminyltransferase
VDERVTIYTMIYDGFTFFRELDLLEIRLHELADVVDKFILVECDRTHSNLPKPFYYEENKDRFKDYWDKIIHVKIYNAERYHDPSIEMGIDYAALDTITNNDQVHFDPEDLIILGASDQIMRASALRNFSYQWPTRVEMRYYYYYFNCRHIECNWYGSTIWKYKDMYNTPRHIYSSALPEYQLNEGGWHYSYMGGKEMMRSKIESLAHAPTINKPEFKTDEHMDWAMVNGIDLWNRTYEGPMGFVPIDNDNCPQYVLDNMDKFKNYFLIK